MANGQPIEAGELGYFASHKRANKLFNHVTPILDINVKKMFFIEFTF
jgi:hypothetical protein